MRLRECMMVAELLAGWTVVTGMVVGVESDLDSAVEPLVNHLDSKSLNVIESKSLEDLCAAHQTLSCLKLTLLRRIGRFSRLPSMELFPGLTVSGNMTSLQQLPSDVTADQLDEAFLRCLSSLSVTVRVVDGGVMEKLREMGVTLAGETAVNETAINTGRRRPGNNMMMAGLVSGGSMMALGMSAVAMMAGKALLAALMSLMLSAMAAMKGGGGGGSKSSYEVVHAGHDFKHRSIEVDTSESGYPYMGTRRNIYIPLHQRR